MKALRILALLVAVAFALLLIVGFDNILAIFRSRVALFLVIAPIFVLFVWCVYKAIQPQNRLRDRGYRDK
ncbi:MAG: hypothetical protein LV479_04125 [Methylacidiphilales bacterium]|nr:hypothetical protein [Candidatus Methylacidiphilales bacterium]